jgi:hypothetical protein
MPKAPTRQARAERNLMMRADRARGLTVRQIAAQHAVSVGLVHRLVSDVHVIMPNRWHRARQREEPSPRAVNLHWVFSKA